MLVLPFNNIGISMVYGLGEVRMNKKGGFNRTSKFMISFWQVWRLTQNKTQVLSYPQHPTRGAEQMSWSEKGQIPVHFGDRREHSERKKEVSVRLSISAVRSLWMSSRETLQ